MQPSPMTDPASDHPIDLLDALEQVLREEAEALDQLDVAAIDRAAEAKQQIADAWDAWKRQSSGATLSDEQRTRIAEARERVGDLARSNHIRLRASLEAVKGVIGAVTGTAATTYGRRNTDTIVRPVLTSSVG